MIFAVLVAFVKKWWRWILAGGAVLGAFLLGILRKQTPISPVPSDVQRDTEKETKTEEKKLDDQAVADASIVVKNHEVEQKQAVDAATANTEKIKDDPQAVNDFLLDVGKKQRGG